MKLNEIQARLPAWYLSSIAPGGAAPIVLSDPGRGKTSVIESFPKMMKRVDPKSDYGMVTINGACLTLATASGYLWPHEETRPDGSKFAYSRFTKPDWWFTKDGRPLESYDGGYILVDEVDKCGIDEKKILGEGALSKRVASHWLPDRWAIIFAGNYAKNKSGSTKELNHLILRRREIHVRDDQEAWKEWAIDAGLLSEVITCFGEDNPQLLFEPQPDLDPTNPMQRPYGTPRTVHQVDIYLKALMQAFGTDKIPVDPLTQEEIAGSIGAPAAAALVTSIRLGQELASYEEVARAPAQAKLPSKPDGKRLMSYKLAEKVTVQHAPKVLEYMARMEQEFQVIFVRMAVARNYELAFEKTFAQWCASKAALIAVLNRYKNQDK